MAKQEGSTTTHFLYAGPSLLHEKTGSESRDYIYLRGEIVGMVQAGAPSTLYYVHNDHIGRPEIVTNSAKQKVWEAENNAFGNLPVLDAIGGFNVGFPGQYQDVESGMSYNYFRDYDPSSGRYLQSDPIGLAGGLNTYGYVGGNPTNRIDPYGLDFFGTSNRDVGIIGGCASGTIIGIKIGAGPCALSTIGYPACEAIAALCGCVGVAVIGGLGGVIADQVGDITANNSSGASDDDDAPSNTEVVGGAASGDPNDDKDGSGDGSLGANPFIGKTPEQIDKMLRDKGYQPRGPDPMNGRGGYVNPRTGRSYHIDPGGTWRSGTEGPHVDVNRLPGSNLPKRKYPTTE